MFVPCYLLGNKFTFVRLCVRVKAQREKVRRKRRWCRFRFSRYRDIWKEIDFPFSCLVRWRWQLVFLLTIVPLLYLFKDFESCVLYIGSLHLRSIYRLPWPVKFVFLFFSLVRLQNLKLKTFPSVASPTLLLTYRILSYCYANYVRMGLCEYKEADAVGAADWIWKWFTEFNNSLCCCFSSSQNESHFSRISPFPFLKKMIIKRSAMMK